MNHSFGIKHAKVLYLRFCAIYDHKFVKAHHDQDFKDLWATEWCSGLSGTSPNVIKHALEHCKKNFPWPPSIAEFIAICEMCSGVPTLEQAMDLAVRRNFTHPVVLLAYEKVGSWAMKNDSEKQLRTKFESAYAGALIQFRENAHSTWEKLESYNISQASQALPEPEPVNEAIPHRTLKERLDEYRQKIANNAQSSDKNNCRVFEEKHIKKTSREFDPKIHAEYREYLLSIPEEDTNILPIAYMYDRNRFICQKEARSYVESVRPIPTQREENKEPAMRYNQPKKVYDAWSKD